MAGAKVESLDALKAFRIQLFKFAEAVNVALGDAESDMHRTLMWLDTEQLSYWQGQIRKRQELLAKALDALRQKTLYKDATGRVQSAVDEQKVVNLCRKRLEVAVQKLANVKVYSRRLQKEVENYRGSTQRFATTVQGELPVYAAKIDRMASTLQAYVDLTSEDVSAAAAQAFAGERTRAAAEAAGYGAAEPAEAPAVEAEEPAKEPELEPCEFPALRKLTPAEPFRLTAPPGLMPTANWKTRPLNNQQCESLAAVPAERDVPDPSDRIIVRRESEKSATIYLERVEAKTQGDSGWYVAPAVRQQAPAGAEDASATVKLVDDHPPINAMRVSDFLAVRPDLQNLLSLPKGFLVVVTPSEVRAVLNSHDQDVWELKEAARGARYVDELGDEADGEGG
jgi:hypothetical protein